MTLRSEYCATVPVDSGSIGIAKKGTSLEEALELYTDVLQQSLCTARVAWDGEKGAIKTPHGDGPHQVAIVTIPRDEAKRLPQITSIDWVHDWGKEGVPGKPGFTFDVGDCGCLYGTVNIPSYHYLGFRWVRNRLEFVVLLDKSRVEVAFGKAYARRPRNSSLLV